MPVKMIAYCLALAAIVGAGVLIAGRHYQPTIDRLNASLSQCAAAGKQQAATIAKQNAGIELLQRADEERQAQVKEWQEMARQESRNDYNNANEVLSERTTGEVCAAASAAFDDELRRERAK